MTIGKGIRKIALFAGFVVCVIFMTVVHEPWLDELHAWVMARDMSFPELLSAMRVEGHFCLWYLLLMPFAKAGLGVAWLQVVSVALTLLAAWLLIFKTSLGYWAKVAVLLSFPMIYCFPAISRCYALIPPILFGTALVYRNLTEKRYLFAVLVGLLAHTHVYMEGMVLALFLVYLYEIILPKYKEKQLKFSDFGPPVVMVIFVLLAFVQVARNPFSPIVTYLGNEPVVRTTSSLKGLEPTIRVFFKYYSVIPVGMVEAGKKAIVAYTLGFIPMLILILKMLAGFDRTGRFIALVSIGWQFLFSLFIYSFGLHRVYLAFFIFLSIFMMGKAIGRKENIMIICLCVLASISGYVSYIWNDVKLPYSDWKQLAKSIETNVPKDEPVFSTVFFGDCVTPYLSDKDIELVTMPLDSIKDESFYAICWPKNHSLEKYEDRIVYEDPDCFKDRYLLVEFKRLEP